MLGNITQSFHPVGNNNFVYVLPALGVSHSINYNCSSFPIMQIVSDYGILDGKWFTKGF